MLLKPNLSDDDMDKLYGKIEKWDSNYTIGYKLTRWRKLYCFIYLRPLPWETVEEYAEMWDRFDKRKQLKRFSREALGNQ